MRIASPQQEPFGHLLQLLNYNEVDNRVEGGFFVVILGAEEALEQACVMPANDPQSMNPPEAE